MQIMVENAIAFQLNKLLSTEKKLMNTKKKQELLIHFMFKMFDFLLPYNFYHR